MTQNPDTFQNLTEAQIEEIIAKVEASKPWSGWVRTGELFLLRLYTTIAFTLMGLHFCFSKFSYLPNKETSYGVFAVFVMLDIFFFFNKNKFDRRTIADWTRAILTQEDFFKEKGYGYLKWTTIIYIASVILVCTVTNNTHIHYSLAFAYTFIMAIWYKTFNVFWLGYKIMNDYKIFNYKFFTFCDIHTGGNPPFLVVVGIIIINSVLYYGVFDNNTFIFNIFICFLLCPVFFLFGHVTLYRHLKLSFLALAIAITSENLQTRKIT